MLRTLVFVSLLASLSTGCAAPSSAEEEGSTTSNIVGGALTYQRPEIGAVENHGLLCTGTLVAANVVVTAAHCIDFNTLDAPGSRLGTFRIDLADGPHEYPYESQIAYGTSLGSDDVALLRLRDFVPSEVATPAKIASSPPADDGDIVLFGYGCQDRGGILTAHGAPLDKKQVLLMNSTWSRSLCPGDSGGPSTIGRDGPVFRVASAYHPAEVLGVGLSDTFGDLIRCRGRLMAQIQTWSRKGSHAPPTASTTAPAASTARPPPNE